MLDPASREYLANRRREPWVLEGLKYLHHPLRVAHSAKYVRPALDLVWEIQKTGDIFFPNAWTGTVLGGYSSADTAGEVRRFLAMLPPNYPTRLRNIVLQNVDDLFRAAGQ